MRYWVLKPDAYILFQLFFSAYGGGDAIIVVFTFLSNFYILPYHVLVETGGKGDEVGAFPIRMT